MSLECRILDAMTVGVFVVGSDRRILHWNAWMMEATGRLPSEAVGRRIETVFPDAADIPLMRAITNALTRELSTVLSHNLHPNLLPQVTRRGRGESRMTAKSVQVRPIGEGGERHCLVQITDVTAAVRREAHLREMATYSRMLFDVGVDPLATIDAHGRITDVNGAFEAAAGRQRNELIGATFASCFTDPETLTAALARAKASGSETDTPLRLRHRDGRCLDVLYSFTVFRVPNGGATGVLASARDITERLKAARELEILATTDSLTGLANRRHFMDQAEKEVARATRYHRDLALFVLDLDHFKQINDTYGHAAGDEVLRCVGEACRTTVRSSDTIGRMGGEELAILLPETGLEQAERLGERLRAAIASLRVTLRETDIRITTSIGVAVLWPRETMESFLTRADNALYGAKRRGRNCIAVDTRPEKPLLPETV